MCSCEVLKAKEWVKKPYTIVCKREDSYVLVWNETRDKEHHTIAQIEGNPNVIVGSVKKLWKESRKSYTIAGLEMCSCMVQ